MDDFDQLDQQQNKQWYQSRAVWGGVIAAGSGIAAALGHGIDSDTQKIMADTAVTLITSAVTIVGGLLAVYGRLKARRSIGKGR